MGSGTERRETRTVEDSVAGGRRGEGRGREGLRSFIVQSRAGRAMWRAGTERRRFSEQVPNNCDAVTVCLPREKGDWRAVHGKQ